jgi:hypothetical protein
VRISAKSDPSHDEVRLDLTKEELEQRFLGPYREGRPVVISGKTIQPNDLERIRVSYTKQTSEELLPAIKAEREADSVVAVSISDEWYVAYRGKDVTDELIVTPSGLASIASQQTEPETIRNLSTAIEDLRKRCNEAARFQGLEPIFKPTTNTEYIAAKLPSYVSQTERDFKDFVDMLYRFLIESAGKRVLRPTPKWEEALDAVKGLRHYFFHDLEHGDESSIEKKYKHVGAIYETLINKKLPEQNDWVKLQVELLKLASSGVQEILEEISKDSMIIPIESHRSKLIKPVDRATVPTPVQEVQYDGEDRHLTALILYYVMSMFGISWSTWWIVDPTDAFGRAFLTTMIVGGAVYGLAYLMSWDIGSVIRKAKDWFPVVALVSCCFVVASFALQYSILNYPAKNGLAFSSHLSDSPIMSLLALGSVLTGGVVLELPAIADARKSKTNLRHVCFRWMRLNRRLLVSTIVLAILFGFVFANVATIDSNLVLFTPKVGFVETRYLIDGQLHVYQIGLATFGAWSQNERIVHIMTPLFPLITEGSYSFVTNSTTRLPSILSATGLSASSPTEDAQGRIVVTLTTDSTSLKNAQFSVQFYSEFNVTQLAYIYFSPRTFIRNFPNGTQQLQQKFVVVNHSAFSLYLDHIVLYSGGYAPLNQSLKFYPPQAFPQPYFYYSNDTRTFSLYGSIGSYGNLTAIVIYNSP